MSQWPGKYRLTKYQLDFVEEYLSRKPHRALLVAAPGTGKSITSLYTAYSIKQETTDTRLLVISPRKILADQWLRTGTQTGFHLHHDVSRFQEPGCDGVSCTYQAFRSEARLDELRALSGQGSVFAVLDEVGLYQTAAASIAKTVLRSHTNRVLCLSSYPLLSSEGTLAFDLETEYLYQPKVLVPRATRIEIARFSPSHRILRQILSKGIRVDDLTWREFERLVAELLEHDGYEIQLMRGTKDGGVDVVAVKDLGAGGTFKALWQAKKKRTKNRVGVSTIRELADTRSEFKASKAIIVTTSYLTRDALARVQRDKYILGKVDRDDLDGWIDRVLFRQDSG